MIKVNLDKKISVFLPSIDGGGAERVMVLLCNELVARGMQVELVLGTSGGVYQAILSDKVKVICLNEARVSKALFACARYLKRGKPDVLISAMKHSNLMCICAKMISRVKTKLLIVDHNNFSKANSSNSYILSKLFLFLMRVLYPRADLIGAVSKGVAEDLSRSLKLPNERVNVLYNPVIDGGFDSKSREVVEFKWFNEDIPTFVGVGRLTEQKNFNLLIDAFYKYQKKNIGRLLILGEGEERNALEKKVSELGLDSLVEMPGFLQNPYAYLRNSSVFVLSSDWEGLPTCLIEALACGLPIVSTNCPSGPLEILENGKWGALVPVGDAEALAEAMESAIKNNHNAERLVERSEFFSVEKAVDRYIELLGVDER